MLEAFVAIALKLIIQGFLFAIGFSLVKPVFRVIRAGVTLVIYTCLGIAESVIKYLAKKF